MGRAEEPRLPSPPPPPVSVSRGLAGTHDLPGGAFRECRVLQRRAPEAQPIGHLRWGGNPPPVDSSSSGLRFNGKTPPPSPIQSARATYHGLQQLIMAYDSLKQLMAACNRVQQLLPASVHAPRPSNRFSNHRCLRQASALAAVAVSGRNFHFSVSEGGQLIFTKETAGNTFNLRKMWEMRL